LSLFSTFIQKEAPDFLIKFIDTPQYLFEMLDIFQFDNVTLIRQAYMIIFQLFHSLKSGQVHCQTTKNVFFEVQINYLVKKTFIIPQNIICELAHISFFLLFDQFPQQFNSQNLPDYKSFSLQISNICFLPHFILFFQQMNDYLQFYPFHLLTIFSTNESNITSLLELPHFHAWILFLCFLLVMNFHFTRKCFLPRILILISPSSAI
jgi:hypothetical protein